MVKKALLSFSISILVLMFALALIVSNPSLLSRLVNQLVLPQSTELTCLDYQLNSFSQIYFPQVCIVQNSSEVNARDLRYNLLKHTLVAEQVKISISNIYSDKSSPSPSPGEGIVIPTYLPRFTVNNLVLQSDDLPVPLQFSFEQQTAHQFAFASSSQSEPALIRQGNIEITETGVRGSMAWSPSAAFALFNSPPLLRDGVLIDDALITSEFALSGETLNSQHQLEQLLTLKQQNCKISLSPKGVVHVDYFSNKRQGELDLSNLEVVADLSSCQTLPEAFKPPIDQQVGISFDGSANLQKQILTLPSILIESLASDFLMLSFKDIKSTEFDRLSFRGELTNNLAGVAQLNAEFALQLTEGKVQASGNITSAELKIDDIIAKDINTEFSFLLPLAEKTSGTGEINLHVETITSTQGSVSNLSSTLGFQLNEGNRMQVSGVSQIEHFKNNLVSTSLSAKHQLDIVFAELSFNGNHHISTPSELTVSVEHAYSSQLHDAKILLHEQAAERLNRLVAPFGAHVLEGTVSGQANIELNSMSGSGHFNTKGMAVKYGEYQASGIEFSPVFLINSANLQLSPSMFDITNLDAGIEITHIKGTASMENGRYQISNLQGGLLGGSLEIDSAWLDNKDQTVTLKLREIDLQSIMQTQQEAGIDSSGIVLSGKLNGDIPVKLESGQASIALASLINSTEGTLKITGNSGFEALKAQQPEIGQQLALLEHVKFETLTSDLSMGSDGMVFFDMKIQGINPEHKQPINFNYTHEQNIYTLLKALRLSEQIEQSIQQKMTGDQQE